MIHLADTSKSSADDRGRRYSHTTYAHSAKPTAAAPDNPDTRSAQVRSLFDKTPNRTHQSETFYYIGGIVLWTYFQIIIKGMPSQPRAAALGLHSPIPQRVEHATMMIRQFFAMNRNRK